MAARKTASKGKGAVAAKAAAAKKVQPQEEDAVSRFLIEGKPYEIDAANLTWGEVEEVEMYFDCSFEDVDWNTGRGALILAYLAVKRTDENASLDYFRALPIDAIGRDETERPT